MERGAHANRVLSSVTRRRLWAGGGISKPRRNPRRRTGFPGRLTVCRVGKSLLALELAARRKFPASRQEQHASRVRSPDPKIGPFCARPLACDLLVCVTPNARRPRSPGARRHDPNRAPRSAASFRGTTRRAHPMGLLPRRAACLRAHPVHRARGVSHLLLLRRSHSHALLSPTRREWLPLVRRRVPPHLLSQRRQVQPLAKCLRPGHLGPSIRQLGRNRARNHRAPQPGRGRRVCVDVENCLPPARMVAGRHAAGDNPRVARPLTHRFRNGADGCLLYVVSVVLLPVPRARSTLDLPCDARRRRDVLRVRQRSGGDGRLRGDAARVRRPLPLAPSRVGCGGVGVRVCAVPAVPALPAQSSGLPQRTPARPEQLRDGRRPAPAQAPLVPG